MDRKFYVTTPIYYVNDKPHIGHAYTTILADVLARFHRNLGEDVFFLTGLDEHGQKVQQAADKRHMAPQKHCDDLAPRFINLWKKLEIQNDDFIRTTQHRHKQIVQKALQLIFDKGDVYADEYEGWYSVAEERFITETDVQSGNFRDVKKIKEKNYFFRMSTYQDALVKYIEDNPGFIQPAHRRNEILGFLRKPLGDLCISRPKSRLAWGIELPFDKEYVTYVWFDALLNYLTAPGYFSNDESFKKWWHDAGAVHLIGKDILTTHCVFWPTMLMALGLPMPKTVLAHGWWMVGATKMSKSLGNIVDPLDLIDNYGVDAVRFFLMKEMVLGQDANFTVELFIKSYNSNLANDFGNLLNRVSGLITKYFDGIIPDPDDKDTEEEKKVKAQATQLSVLIEEKISHFKVDEAIEQIMMLISQANSYLEKQAPWKVAKTDLKRAGTILYTATEALRLSALALSPVMPQKTKQVLDVLGACDAAKQWGGLQPKVKLQDHEALFPRIEVPKNE